MKGLTNPIVIHRLAKNWLISGTFGCKNLPLIIVFLILKYLKVEGQGSCVYLERDIGQCGLKPTPFYVFMRYSNVVKGTVMLYVPSVNRKVSRVLYINDSEIYIDEHWVTVLDLFKSDKRWVDYRSLMVVLISFFYNTRWICYNNNHWCAQRLKLLFNSFHVRGRIHPLW